MAKINRSFYKYLNVINLVLLLFAAYVYVLTSGEFNVLSPDYLGSIYVKMWESLKEGRFDIERQTLGIEAYTRDGKTYTYFGPFPALLRGLIELFFKFSLTDWSRLSIIIAAIIVVFSCSRAYYIVSLKTSSQIFTRYFYTTLYGLAIAFGSPVLILLSSASIYHESAMWGLAWACVFILALVKFLNSEKINLSVILILSTSAGFALLSKVTLGIVPILVIAILLGFIIILTIYPKIPLAKWIQCPKESISPSKLKLILISGSFLVLICGVFALKVNYERWGNPFTFCAIEYYDLFTNTKRGEIVKQSGIFNPARIPHALTLYFLPSKEHFSTHYPFIYIASENSFTNNFKPAVFDKINPVNPLPVNSPYLFVCFLVGLLVLTKAYNRLALLIILIYATFNLSFLSYYAVAIRYLTEFIPLIVLVGLPSFHVFNSLENKSRLTKYSTRLIALIIVFISSYASFITMQQVRLTYWYYEVPQILKEKAVLILKLDKSKIKHDSPIKTLKPINGKSYP